MKGMIAWFENERQIIVQTRLDRARKNCNFDGSTIQELVAFKSLYY